MPTYTHTFEIKAGDVALLQGDIAFDHGTPAIKTDGSEEMAITQHGKLQALFEALCLFHCGFGDIDKIEINKK